jgi:MFS transporter, PAT family, beta-lactamase induction signal transducer AmpG
MFKSFSAKFLLIGALGFFSGLPLALTASTLSAWLADAKVDRASIGLFAAIATPYALKFLWSPLMDGLRLPVLTKLLGRRRGWLLFVQALLAAAILAMAGNDPAVNQWLTALFGVIVATLSATQDIVIDAYRVETLKPEEQGTGAGWVTFGYRIGMLVSGAGSLYLADKVGWHSTYVIMAAIMAVSLVLTLIAREPLRHCEEGEAQRGNPSFAATEEDGLPRRYAPRNDGGFIAFFRDYVIAPFRDFMTRPQWLAVLAFVILYKLGDAFMGTMFNPFLLDLGFTKTQIASVVKVYGLIATLVGVFAGGWVVARIGMFRALMLCGFTHMLTNFLLIVQARLGADVHFLTITISLENFTGGMSTAAFIAYLSALCKVNYTATQYALLSSLAAFGRTWLSTPSGWLSKMLGWEIFFAIASLMAVPGLMLLVWLEKKKKSSLRGA